MGTSVSSAAMARIRTAIAAVAAVTLALCLLPATSFGVDADSVGAGFDAERSAASPVKGTPAHEEGSSEAATPTSAEAAISGNASVNPVAASYVLAASEGSAAGATPTSMVSADVALNDDEAVIGSFTVDGLTYSVNSDSLALVSVDPAAASDGIVSIPETVTYNGTAYPVTSIAPYAFYLSGATSGELPETIVSVDDRAFRSSDVERVDVEAGNPNLASFDGALYSADKLRLLLIPEGRAGAVLLPSEAEVVETGKFSHCSLVDAISVEEGGANFASWEGLLYTADGTTLLRVPAGATEITIRDGCTTIAAGALEGCANLERINASATVTSISPDIFTSIPTVALPAQLALRGEANSGVASTLADQSNAFTDSAPQLTALVALSTSDGVPKVDPGAIAVQMTGEGSLARWEARGFVGASDVPLALLESATASKAYEYRVFINGGNGGSMTSTQYPGQTLTGVDGQSYSYGNQISFASAYFVFSNYTIQYRNNGCTFNCWSLASSIAGSSTRWTGGTRTMTSNAYAIWNVPITWNANGGYWNGNPSDTANKSNTWTSNTAARGYGGTAVPQRFGYRFTGWKSSVTGAVTQAGSNVPVQTATTYTAQWVSDYTIHFDGNVVDDAAHPATVPADKPAVRDQAVELATPTRFGYIFKGWATHPSGSTANGHKVLAPGEKAMNLTEIPGDIVTLYALWALKYDADVPVGAPADVTFALDSTNTGEVKAVPADYAGDFSPEDIAKMGSTHEMSVESRMAVPVAITSVSVELAAEDAFEKVLASTDGSPADEQLAFTIASGDAKASIKAGESEALSGLLVPEASESTPVAKLPVSYGLELAETAVVLEPEGNAAVPVANVCYTLDVIKGMASKWGFFMLDGGTPVTPTRIKKAADDMAEADWTGDIAASNYHSAFQAALDAATPFYLRVDDQPGGEFSVHEVNILGLCQDALTVPRVDASGATIATKAGITLGFKDLYAYGTDGADGTFDCRMNLSNTNIGSWGDSALRKRMRGSFADSCDAALRQIIAPVDKFQQMNRSDFDAQTGTSLQKTSGETVWVPSAYEVFGALLDGSNYSETEQSNAVEGYASFQYEAFQGNAGSMTNPSAIKTYGDGEGYWWLRSATYNRGAYFCLVSSPGELTGTNPANAQGVLPCFCL